MSTSRPPLDNDLLEGDVTAANLGSGDDDPAEASAAKTKKKKCTKNCATADCGGGGPSTSGSTGGCSG